MAEGRKANARQDKIRCAIYTRKSHEEGLNQEFNSLDAQREACVAYIASQKHEGWVCLPALYDDGGISGATMERPALKSLLNDIENRQIDAVVVYKVDRLTRSLADFAKIVDVFDRHEVSFVSVTQQFNTTTSMGRLTLNMLLSFAQFEREVTGERIRDKIAASKKKGMWMGGLPPLGYDVQDRKLVVNDAEADTVRDIYRHYADLGSVRALKDKLDHHGIVSKVRIDKYGRQTGGKPFARGALYRMLQNRIYRGEIVHKDKSYPGQHEAIINEALWDAVQERLASNRVERESGCSAADPSLLAGFVFDETGTAMVPSHANKNGTRYRYYVSRSLVRGRRQETSRGRRVPAGDLETIVSDCLCRFLASENDIYGAIEPFVTDLSTRMEAVGRCAARAAGWSNLSPADKRISLITLIERVDLKHETVDIHVRTEAIAAIEPDGSTLRGGQISDPGTAATVVLSVPARLTRTGIEMRLLIEGSNDTARRASDHSLHRLLGQAQRYRAMVMKHEGKSISELAAEAGVGSSYFSRILRLGFLSPDIVTAILRDRHPLELTAKRLASEVKLPIDWEAQRSLLGIA